MLSVVYADCHMLSVTRQPFYAECHYAKCPHAQCHYDECRGATLTSRASNFIFRYEQV
jgi:hypothetical protein